MYSIRIEGAFTATHHVAFIDGRTEAPHTHHWVVRATFCCNELDSAAMVADFDLAQTRLDVVLGELNGADLNNFPALFGRNPTAEVVARHVFDRLRRGGLDGVHRVEVTEAPGCVAAYQCDADVPQAPPLIHAPRIDDESPGA